MSQTALRWHIQKVDGSQGFIDSTGKEIYTGKFDFLSDNYHNGLAFFRNGNESGFLNSTGDLVFNTSAPWAEFSEGLCSINDSKHFYYLNPKGEIALDLAELELPEGKEISECYNFHNGLAAVRIQNIGHKDIDRGDIDAVYTGNTYPGDWYYGFINKAGKWIIKPNLDDISYFRDGISIVVKDGSTCFLDSLGHYVAILDSLYAVDYSQGFAIVWADSTTYFINKLGKRINNNEYSRVKPFSNGMAAVEIDEKWGFIDSTGSIVIEPTYFLVNDFKENLASVSIEVPDTGYFLNSYFIEGFLDKKGNTKIPFAKHVDYNYKGFTNGITQGRRFIYTQDKRYTGYYELFYINKSGKKIWSEILKQ